MKQMKKFIVSIITIILLMGCGGNSGSAQYTGGHYAAETNSAAMTTEGVADYSYDAKEAAEEAEGTSETVLSQEKLVYRGSLSIETLGYEETVKNMRALIQQFNGIVENENESDNAGNWYSTSYQKTRGTKDISLTVRIPTKDFNAFLEAMEGTGKIVNRSTNVENITRRYNSVSTEIESLKIQQERLLEMLKNAETVEDMILIESRLSEVETQLKLRQNERADMDTDVNYSTVNIYIREVMEYTPAETGMVTANFWRRVGETFKWAFTFFIYLIQQIVLTIIRLIPIAIIAVPVIFLFRYLRKKFPKKEKVTKERKPFFQRNKKDKETEQKIASTENDKKES